MFGSKVGFVGAGTQEKVMGAEDGGVAFMDVGGGGGRAWGVI